MCEHELRGEEAWAFLANSLAAANARVAELSDEYNHKCRVAQSWFEKHNDALQRAEQAEAQCAAMRNCKNCRKEMLPKYNYQCEGCFTSNMGKWEPKEDIADAGTALLEDNRRMREALEKARPALVRADSDTSYIAHRYSHALKNANCPLTEDELLKTSGLCREAAKLAQQALKGGA